jgi:hypothetical protein
VRTCRLCDVSACHDRGTCPVTRAADRAASRLLTPEGHSP